MTQYVEVVPFEMDIAGERVGGSGRFGRVVLPKG